MGYIGAEPATSFETVRKDRFTSQTGTTVTLSHTVSSINDIVVWVNSVKQDYTNYSVSGTTLTLGGSLVSADIVEVAYIGRTFQTVAPDTNMVTNAMMADDSIDSAEIVDGSVDTAHIGALQVTTAKIAADAIDGTKIADDAINSEHYTDGSIDTAHINDLNVTTAKIAADAITGAKLADDAVDSEHYTDASIDNAHLADDAVGVAELSATGTASSSTFLRGDNSWAAAGGGIVVSSGFLSTGTRAAISAGTGEQTLWTTGNFNKTTAGTDLFIVVQLAHKASGSGGNELWVKYGSGSSNYNLGLFNYTGTYGGQTNIVGSITGHTTTGNQAFTIGFNHENSANDSPLSVFNPNSTDDARFGQTYSTMLIWEIDNS